MTRKIIGIAFAAVGLLVANPLFAANGTMVYNDGGHTPDAALDWNDPNNWVEGQIASGSDSKATLPSANYQPYILAPDGLTLKDVGDTEHDNHPPSRARVICDGTMTLGGAWGVMLYGDVAFTGSPVVAGVTFCGPLSMGSDNLLSARDNIGFRRDLFADSASEEIVDPFLLPNFNVYQSQSCAFFAPRGSEAVTGTWTMTEGSRFLTLAGEAHTVSVGAMVSGEGIPEGAYVKRYFTSSSEMIEISKPAEASGDKTVTFAAFTPKMRQTIGKVTVANRSNVFTATLQANKYREEDDLRIDILSMENDKQFDITVSTASECVPGTLAFHRTADWKNDRTLTLGNCHVEFGDPGDGSAAGWTTGPSRLSSASVTARVTVANDVAARLSKLTSATGTLVKDGAGTLTAAVPDAAAFVAAGKGTLVVEEGTFALETVEEGCELAFAGVSLAADATLELGGQTVDCGVLSFESGASVCGNGKILVPFDFDSTGLVVGSGVEVIRVVPQENLIAESDYITELPAAGVPGDPVFWFDASDAASLTIDGSSGKITRWNDHRGEEHLYAYPWTDARSSTLVMNEQGDGVCVQTVNSSSTTLAGRYGLRFARGGADITVSGIKVLFKVLSAAADGGVLLGGNDDFKRTASSKPTRVSPLFADSEKFAGLSVFFNGELGDWTKGYPYAGGASAEGGSLSPVLVDMCFSTAESSSCFGYVGKNLNGTDMVCECIAYTNELTQAEILQVRRYLLEKWVHADVTLDSALGRQIPTCAAGSVKVAAEHVAEVVELDGSLAKYGAGQLVVGDVSGPSFSLHVAEGSLSLRSCVVTPDDLPDGLAFHVDADAEDSMTKTEQGKVQEWRDVRGAGYPVAIPHDATKEPSRIAVDELGGRHAISLGSFDESRSAWGGCDMKFAEMTCAHTVITLSSPVGSSGGYLVGYGAAPTVTSDAYLYGLYRNAVNSANPLMGGGSSLAMTGGGVRASLNGTAVNPYETGFTGGWDIASVTSYQRVYADCFTSVGGQAGKGFYSFGGKNLAECLVFTNALTVAEVKRVESYLNRKWFGRETPGCRPQTFAALTVDSGATVKVEGNAPLTVSALSGAGAVNGALKLAAGAVLTAVADADGVIRPISVTGGADISAGGTVMIDSPVAKLAVGSYNLLPVNSEAGTWRLGNAEGFKRKMSLAVKDGYLVLTVHPNGMLLLVR